MLETILPQGEEGDTRAQQWDIQPSLAAAGPCYTSLAGTP